MISNHGLPQNVRNTYAYERSRTVKQEVARCGTLALSAVMILTPQGVTRRKTEEEKIATTQQRGSCPNHPVSISSASSGFSFGNVFRRSPVRGPSSLTKAVETLIRFRIRLVQLLFDKSTIHTGAGVEARGADKKVHVPPYLTEVAMVEDHIRSLDALLSDSAMKHFSKHPDIIQQLQTWSQAKENSTNPVALIETEALPKASSVEERARNYMRQANQIIDLCKNACHGMNPDDSAVLRMHTWAYHKNKEDQEIFDFVLDTGIALLRMLADTDVILRGLTRFIFSKKSLGQLFSETVMNRPLVTPDSLKKVILTVPLLGGFYESFLACSACMYLNRVDHVRQQLEDARKEALRKH